MFRTILTAASAGTALVVASPLLAQAHGGGAASAGAHAQGAANASPMGMMNASPNSMLSRSTITPPVTVSPQTSVSTSFSSKSQAEVRSQGPANASTTGISHANQNSVLARSSVSATALPGLTTGLKVSNSAGVSIGTVSQVVTASDGSIRAVIVQSPSGQMLRLPPNSLSISGKAVTTTSTTVGL